MKLQIGSQATGLLAPQPVYESLPSGQADAYRLFIELGEGGYSEESILNQLGLQSRLPLWSRVEHLEERGMVRVVKAISAV